MTPGQFAKVKLTGEQIMVLRVFAAPTSDQAAVYEVRLNDYRKIQLAAFELEEVLDADAKS